VAGKRKETKTLQTYNIDKVLICNKISRSFQ